MKRCDFIRKIEENPIIPAIKDDGWLRASLKADADVVFVLYGDIGSVVKIVQTLKDSGKIAIVHIDLISGLQPKEVALDYIRNYTLADGIITTKYNLIPHARELGLNSILRVFLLDSTALSTLERNCRSDSQQPDIMEILPGALLPQVIRRIHDFCRVPVMFSGMITQKSEVLNALDNGAISTSTTNRQLWDA